MADLALPRELSLRPNRRPTFVRHDTPYHSQNLRLATLPESAGVGIHPERLDYFEETTGGAKNSPRALINLSLLASGRILIAFGLGGLSNNSAFERPGMPKLPPPHHAKAHVAMSGAAVAFGCILALAGMSRFARDTAQLNPKRAVLMASCSLIGVCGVAGGGFLFNYGRDIDSYNDSWLACLPRVVGNFLIFGTLPNSFSASEMVHGNVKIPNREVIRQVSFAFGGAMMMFWAHITNPGLNAPLYAKELVQSAAIVGLIVGGALARTTLTRIESQQRVAVLQAVSPGQA